jgi:hypothetical protein
MANPTYTLYSTVTVTGGNPTSLGFTSIPQTATDFLIVGMLKSATTSSNSINCQMQTNGNYPSQNYYVSGDASGGSAGGSGYTTYINTSQSGNLNYTPYTFYMANYSSSTRQKNAFQKTEVIGANDPNIIKMMGLTFSSTSPVTSFTFLDSSGLAAGSSFSLYLINNV